ncbi:HAMP domain-containing sensor histidine kinase [Variovorax sp. YR752]|uniref:sensor histidine kinase n=1 Tax=Variovorax sp. YR752 TaxID=1884383 RepID=UPI003138148D
MTVIVVESWVMSVLAIMFAAVWLRSREPGTGLLSLGFAVATAWYYFSDLAPVTGPAIDTLPERIATTTLIVAILLRTAGVVAYLGMPGGGLRVFIGLCAAPSVVCLVLLLAGVNLPHQLFHFVGLLPYLGAAALAFRCAATEPGNAHGLLGVALLVLPLLPFVLDAGGVPPGDLKYYTGVAVIAFGMLVLTVSLLRRHRALHAEVQRRTEAEARLLDAKLQLEARVSERTAHLRELIGGLESFNRGVSHDLRGPLGGMSQLAHTAAESMSRGDSTLALRALPLIASQCDASVKMVNAMLELARVGEAPAQRVPVELRAVVESAIDEVMLSQADARHTAIRRADLPTVLADPVLLRTALVNLIGNAMKFSREVAQPRIEIESRIEGRDITVCVRDNGAGFPAELAERLFDPFFRAPGTQHEGHGLGLSLTRRAIEAMGGRVWALSRAEGGAELCFQLKGALLATPPTEPLGQVPTGAMAALV